VKFKSSKPFTVGIELEVQIVDRASFNLAPRSDVIFSKNPTPLVQKEFLQSMVEFVTNVCETPEEAVEELKNAVSSVVEIGKSHGFFLSASGTHPFALPSQVKVTENKRYLRLYEEFQEVLRNFLIYGLHVHVGFPDENSALNAYNYYVKYAPLFLALSASSPFFSGRNTGILSYRSKLFEQLPRAGIPQQFSNYEEFVELFERLKEAGFIESLKDVWWDVRLRPDFGTVELRICDSVADFDRLLAIVHLAVIVGKLSLKEKVKPDFLQIHKQNRWNAARYGLKGNFIEREGKTSIGEKIFHLVNRYERLFGNLKESGKLIIELLSKPLQAELELEAVRETKDLKSAVRVSLLEEKG
jgi:carboxylate-amine ligase